MNSRPNSKLGLFENSRGQSDDDSTRPNRAIVDIDICPQLSTNLQAWLTDFRRDLPSIASNPKLRGSIRLRVSPTGLRGVWLDFANEDIRDLLDEETWLTRQLKNGVIVEVGQRRKRVEAVAPTQSESSRRHRLVDPILEPWFETPTMLGTHRAALFSTIGTFTQPGFEAQAALVENVLEKLARLSRSRVPADLTIAEFGSGIGAFTLPLLSTGARVEVFEFDRLALQALERGVAAAGLDRSRLEIHEGDFIQSTRAFDLKSNRLSSYDIVLVDPPRPGLGKFLEAIAMRSTDASWIYVSCFPESFAKDAARLKERGLRLEALTVVEQFPYTRHFEIVASFSRSDTTGSL